MRYGFAIGDLRWQQRANEILLFVGLCWMEVAIGRELHPNLEGKWGTRFDLLLVNGTLNGKRIACLSKD